MQKRENQNTLFILVGIFIGIVILGALLYIQPHITGNAISGITCNDTDGGIKRINLGTITWTNAEYQTYTNTDYCRNSQTLLEYYCSGDKPASKDITCNPNNKAICEQGRCVSPRYASGFDPGMKTALAATTDPQSSYYFESCPSSADNKCYGTIPNKGGFYTIGWDEPLHNCTINTGMMYYEDPGNPNVSCPFYFEWKNTTDKLSAHLTVDTLNFSSGNTRNIYIGLQENTNTPRNKNSTKYFGVNGSNFSNTPYLSNITTISFDMRAKLCPGPQEENRFGRILYYAGLGGTGNGITLSLDLLQYTAPNQPAGALVKTVNTELELCNCTDQRAANVIHVNGYYAGILPPEQTIFVDNTPTCSTPLEEVPWIHVQIPMQQMVQILIDHGYTNTTALEGARYTSGIIGGIETWGRSRVELEIKDHTIYTK